MITITPTPPTQINGNYIYRNEYHHIVHFTRIHWHKNSDCHCYFQLLNTKCSKLRICKKMENKRIIIHILMSQVIAKNSLCRVYRHITYNWIIKICKARSNARMVQTVAVAVSHTLYVMWHRGSSDSFWESMWKWKCAPFSESIL